MPHADLQTNSLATATANGHLDGILPGTTFPEKIDPSPQEHEKQPPASPTSFPGPPVNGRPTKATLFTPKQLSESPLVPSLVSVINAAFAGGHKLFDTVLLPLDRLRYDGQLFDELGSDPQTFTYVLCYAGTQEVLATASAKRYRGVVAVAGMDMRTPKNTFQRFGDVDSGLEAWELSTMAVDPKLQRQGLAGWLMRVTEEEVKRRFSSERGGDEAKRLIFMLTTIKDINGPFYAKRGFFEDYEVDYPKGHLGSSTGFTVLHMSREVKVD